MKDLNSQLRESIELLEESEKAREEQASNQAINQSQTEEVARLSQQVQTLTQELEGFKAL